MGDNKLIRRFRNRLIGFYFVRHLLFCLSFLAFGGGVGVLVGRVLLAHSLERQMGLIVTGIAILTAGMIAMARSLMQVPPIHVLRSVFDKTNRFGGLLMASSEIEIGPWAQRISTIQAPQIKWNGRRSGGIFCLSIFFLGFSLLVPQRYIMAHPAGRLEIGDQVRQVQEQIQVLEEENILTEEKAEDIRQKLDQIEKTASGREPVKTWEALGHLQDQLKKAAEEASVGMLAETEDLTRVQALAQALNQPDGQLDPQVLEGAMSELAQMTAMLMKQNEAMNSKLNGQLAGSADAGQLSPEQLKELVKALQGRKAELSECMGQLCEAKLAEMKLLRMCENSGQCNTEGLKAMLAECEGAQGACDAVSLFMNNPNWGINRGRGDAPMVWADPSSEEGTAFKEQVLPTASLSALKDAQLVGVSVSAPSMEEGQENFLPGNLSTAEAGSAQAVKRTILPKHKQAVQKYFQRDDEQE